MPTLRTFVAVEIPSEVQDRAGVLIERLWPAPAKVKWVQPRHLHWTLKFLGDIDLLEVPAICKAIQDAARPLTPFDVEARGAGAFPDIRRPRTIWLGMGQGSSQMIELHDAIDQSLAKLGYRSENRRFRPHLTIGRVRQSRSQGITELARLLQENVDFTGRESTVFEVVVFSSQLRRDGPTYEPLGHAELEGR